MGKDKKKQQQQQQQQQAQKAAQQNNSNGKTTSSTSSSSSSVSKANVQKAAGASSTATPPAAFPALCYLSPMPLFTLIASSAFLFVFIFLGELLLTSLLKMLFEFVFGERIISLDHAVSQLENPILFHVAVSLFQLVLVSLITFAIAWVSSSFLFSSLSSHSLSTNSPVFQAGSTTPTLLLLGSMALVRAACAYVKFHPSKALLHVEWSNPLLANAFDGAYFGLVALSAYAAVSSTFAYRRIELLEAQERAKKVHLYELAKAEWLKQQQQQQQQQQAAAGNNGKALPAGNGKGQSVSPGAPAEITTPGARVAPSPRK